MKKILFLIVVGAFCLNCGSKTAVNTTTNTAAANKSATPSSTPAPANTATKSNSAAPEKSDAPEKTDGKSNPELDFAIVNKTGYDIKELSIGITGTGDWAKEDEVLKGRTFANGSSMDIKFSPRATAELWDIKVEWADGSKGVEWLKLDLTQIEKVTLTYDRETDKTTAVVE